MDYLAKSGIYFDDVDKICILEPSVSKSSTELQQECDVYFEKIEEFERLSGMLIGISQKLAKEVEKEKMSTIGVKNVLQNMTKEKETLKQQLQVQIAEQGIELENLKTQLASLQKIEMEQNEVINNLSQM
ncbi:intraflagellar transport protein 20 homolog isoform X2 [Agrilus planipennis]|uniref:Intraflagellar transport protein 20 homolog isoform X2 n=1 Tax=Agrilus planipennis TaxID=224129 RepID=A0A1W4X009_AGRPL|nr:intraflagellar transport protein 20 homolog isoform X2 [Agrilus planipennis]